ncbi:MAG: beta-propeller fold lactonase family protein [Mycobacterium sp.]
MANKVANVDDVTDAIASVAVVERASREAQWLPVVPSMPNSLVRSHLHRLPEVAPLAAEVTVVGDADVAPTFAAVGRVSVGAGAITAMAANAFDGNLFVADYTQDSVTVLDGFTLATVATLGDAPEPYALAVAQGRAYISTVVGSHDAVTVADAESVVDTHSLADSIADIVVDRDGRQVYVARTGRDGADVAVIDTATGTVRTVDVMSRAGVVANTLSISGDGRTLYLATTDQRGGRLVIIDTMNLRVIDTLRVAEPIRDMAASHDGATAWVAIDDGESAGVVDAVDLRTRRVLGSVSIDGAVRQLMLSAVGDRVYAVTDEAVVVVCTDTYEVVDTINTGAAPSCITESADGSRLYIADFDGRVALYSVASTTPSLLERMSTPEALAGPAVRELERAGV